MDLGIDGRRAAVAAATAGLGFATARELVREGARVAICSRDPDRVRQAVQTLRDEEDNGREERVEGVVADLSKPGGPEGFIDEARARLGGVDILVANNGGPPSGAAVGLDEEAWRSGFEQTFLSARRLAEAVISEQRRAGWGRIVFVTSTSVKQPIPGLAVSTAMRSAVAGYAKTLADELASSGITVNCVAPGSIGTARLEQLIEERARLERRDRADVLAELERHIPVGRIGRPAEFAAAVAFLVSERASYITGTVLPVDGGMVRSLT